MKHSVLEIPTHGEGFVAIGKHLQEWLDCQGESVDGVLHLFCPHSSCGLVINEGYDPSAVDDMEAFLQYLAPRNLAFIKHTCEGPDDSPSHMKTLLLQSSMTLFVEQSRLVLGQWQQLFIAEFRDQPRRRNLFLKLQQDQPI